MIDQLRKQTGSPESVPELEVRMKVGKVSVRKGCKQKGAKKGKGKVLKKRKRRNFSKLSK